MTQPRLRRSDQSSRHARALDAGKLADDARARRVPGQGGRAGRQIVLARQVEERRQQRALAELARGNQLGNGEGADVRPSVVRSLLQVDAGEGAVGRPQVDADEVTPGGSAGQWLDARHKWDLR